MDLRKTLGIAGILAVLSACGGGGSGGGDLSEATVGLQSNAANAQAASESVAYSEAAQLVATITAVDIPADGRPVVRFQLTDGANTAILDLDAADLRFTIAKLRRSVLGNLTGSWQSYVNRIEVPETGPGTQPMLQAAAEQATEGVLTNNGDGTYTYRFARDISTPEPELAQQAAVEGLDLSYEPDRTHRVAMQFSNSRRPLNPRFDWVPASGETNGILHRRIVATANCNGCHELTMHGGARVEVEYCVTCHNPGSSDANSGNSVDFKVLVHKLHRGADLPSVQAGGEYVIFGFGDRPHDYSQLVFPQDIRNCQICHGGSSTGDSRTTELTENGDDWSVYASASACGSCHDDIDFSNHFGDQTGDENCMSCHQTTGIAGSIRERHVNPVSAAAARFRAEILDIGDTMPGEFPRIRYRVVDPTNNDQPYDLHNDPSWTEGAGDSRLAIDLAWSTSDYENTGNDADDANAVSLDALGGTAVGDGSYSLRSPLAMPDGSSAPGIPARGSGAAAIEGHPAQEIDGTVQRIPMTGAVEFFSIDEADAIPRPRREVVSLDKCLTCHGQLSFHGNSRSDNLGLCVTCHNPRNTDLATREIAQTPPTDGKREETLDFKVMIHAIHAAGYREHPLQIVGEYTAHVYSEEQVHFTGRLSNCLSCHTEDGYTLPVHEGVLGTTVDTGSDRASPVDDVVVSPTAAACSSCHDSDSAAAHMAEWGADFATSQSALDTGETYELCAACHDSRRIEDIDEVHSLQ